MACDLRIADRLSRSAHRNDGGLPRLPHARAFAHCRLERGDAFSAVEATRGEPVRQGGFCNLRTIDELTLLATVGLHRQRISFDRNGFNLLADRHLEVHTDTVVYV